LSLILKKRTIDLYFTDEENAKNWFYGLFCYLNKKENKRNYKISSCTKYLLFRLKNKMINKLKKEKNNKIPLSKCIKEYFIF